MVWKKCLSAICIITFIFLYSCHGISDLGQTPELTPLTQGFKTSAAIGYCTSLAYTAFTGGSLPTNATFSSNTTTGYSNAGIIHASISANSPLPFNHEIGDIYIAGLWDDVSQGGVLSIFFGNYDLLSSSVRIYGLYLIPISHDPVTGNLQAVFAQEDILLGEGTDTLLDLSLSKPKFDAALDRLNGTSSTNTFTAVTQNVWFISVDPKGTLSDLYDDVVTVNGGGQIVEANSTSGGILYHAMIGTVFCYSACASNPTAGTAFVQNFKASGSSVDLGNFTMNFHSTCDGRADVLLATGKYAASTGKTIALGWN